MKKLLLGSAMSLAVAAGASAADLYTKAPIAPVWSWTGFYLGANVGGGWAQDDVTRITPTNSTPAGTLRTDRLSGILGGGQAGFDFQTGQFVFGVVASGDAANITGTTREVSTITGDIGTFNSSIRSIVDVGGRVGYAVGGSWLSYVKGGGAWQRVDSTGVSVTPGGAFVSSTAHNETRSGWFIGGGLEVRYTPNVSLFAEYDHYDFGTQTLGAIVTGGSGAFLAKFPVGTPIFSTFGLRDDVVKVGINWRPNWLGR